MALINGNSFLNNFNLFRRGNDPYVVTPNIGFNNLIDMLTKTEQEISIEGNESELYRTTPHLKAIINRHASMLANGRFQHLDKNGNEIENSPFVKLLQNPNPFQAGNEWLMQQDIQKLVYGNNFIYLLKGSKLAETPKVIWNLTPKKIIVDRTGKIWNQTDASKIVSNYKMNADSFGGNADMTFEPHEILHRNIQDVDDPIVGTSPFHALKMPISNIRSAYGFRHVIMTKKGAIGMISKDGKGAGNGAIPITKDERDKMEKQLIGDYGLSERQKQVLLSTAAWKWNPMSYPTKDLELFTEVDEDSEAIMDEYGMDKDLFAGKATFENKIAGEKSTYQNTIIPEANDLANGLTRKFKLDEKGQKIVLNYDHVAVLQEDQEKKSSIIKNKAEAIKVLQESGLYSNEEIKEIINM